VVEGKLLWRARHRAREESSPALCGRVPISARLAAMTEDEKTLAPLRTIIIVIVMVVGVAAEC
jgi:hypothetical protein